MQAPPAHYLEPLDGLGLSWREASQALSVMLLSGLDTVILPMAGEDDLRQFRERLEGIYGRCGWRGRAVIATKGLELYFHRSPA